MLWAITNKLLTTNDALAKVNYMKNKDDNNNKKMKVIKYLISYQ